MAIPIRNVTLGEWQVDCLWVDEKVVAELDGGQHRLPHQAAVDAERDLWLRANGYVILRYTYRQVTADGEAVLADLAAVLSARRATDTHC